MKRASLYILVSYGATKTQSKTDKKKKKIPAQSSRNANKWRIDPSKDEEEWMSDKI